MEIKTAKSRLLERLLYLGYVSGILLLVVELATTSPAGDYEFSIYEAYSIYFWVIVLLVIILLQINLLINKRRVTKVLLLMQFLNFILLSLPIFRQYALFNRGDVMTHLGYIKDIMKTGHLVSYPMASFSNIYPIHHISGISIHVVTEISLNKITMLVPVVFSLLFILSYHLMVKELLYNDNDIVWSVSLLSGLLLFGTQHTFFGPNVLTFFYIPIVLYLWIKKSITNYFRYLLTILTFVFVILFHPLTSLYLLFIIILFEFVEHIWNMDINWTQNLKSSRHLYLFALLIIIWIAWYFSFQKILYGIKLTLNSILFRDTANPLYEKYSETLSRRVSIIHVLQTAMYRFGPVLILGIISLVALSYLAINMINKKQKSLRYWQWFTILGFISFSFWTIINMFIFMVSFTRVLKYVIFFSIILSGSSLGQILKKEDKKIFCGVLIVLLTLDYFAIFSLYPSPLSRYQNLQVTYAEYDGMMFFFEKRNENLVIYDFLVPQMRFCHAILSVKDKRCYKSIRSYISDTRPEPHFGYPYRPIGIMYKTNVYFILNRLGERYYREIFPEYKEYWRYYPEDFMRLEVDNTVNKIYGNGDLKIHLIVGWKK